MRARIVLILAFVALLVAPFAWRPERRPVAGARRLIVLTPHNDQIRSEFAAGFEAWHLARHGERVRVVYTVPGGTREILRMLEAQYGAAFASDRAPGGGADLVFGGGTYEHERLKRGVRVVDGDGVRDEPISAPVPFDAAWLDEIYGENAIGDGRLYDPDAHWFGTALAAFGIVYNRDVLARLGVPEPTSWQDLGDPRLRGWVALVNPGQSGSIATAFEAVLQHRGWDDGWRLLRRAGANARSISASGLKPPADVSRGDAAMGVCIDFYGRYQAGAIRAGGGGGRVGYVDPRRMSRVDADPVSVLRGAPDAALARRFIEFCLSEEGQALWQFPVAAEGPGPRRFELRRLMIRRVMYERHRDRLSDDVDPFEIAAPVTYPLPAARHRFVAPLFAAMVADGHHELRAAWDAIVRHPSWPAAAGGLVTAAEVEDRTLARMLELFDAMPTVPGPDGAVVTLEPGQLDSVRAGWLDRGWADAGLWPAEATPTDVLRRQWSLFFRENYRQIVALAAGDR